MVKYEIHVNRKEVILAGLIVLILMVFFFLVYFSSLLFDTFLTGNAVNVGFSGDVVGSNFEARVHNQGFYHWSDLVILFPAAIFVLSLSYLIISVAIHLSRRKS